MTLPVSESVRCSNTLQLGCLRIRLYMNGMIMVAPAGGAVNSNRDKRLMKAATRYEGKCLKRKHNNHQQVGSWLWLKTENIRSIKHEESGYIEKILLNMQS